MSRHPTTPVSALLLLLCAQVAFGQTQPTAQDGQAPDEDIASKVVDPTAPTHFGTAFSNGTVEVCRNRTIGLPNPTSSVGYAPRRA